MPVCPRCKHPAERAPAICTQCGGSIPAEAGQATPPSLIKILLLVVLLVLLAVLLMLALMYADEAGRLAR